MDPDGIHNLQLKRISKTYKRLYFNIFFRLTTLTLLLGEVCKGWVVGGPVGAEGAVVDGVEGLCRIPTILLNSQLLNYWALIFIHTLKNTYSCRLVVYLTWLRHATFKSFRKKNSKPWSLAARRPRSWSCRSADRGWRRALPLRRWPGSRWPDSWFRPESLLIIALCSDSRQ